MPRPGSCCLAHLARAAPRICPASASASPPASRLCDVGFKGTPEAAIEVLAGRVHYAILGLAVVQPFIRDGRLLPLAVNTPQRSPLFPDVPALVETLPEFKRPETTP